MSEKEDLIAICQMLSISIPESDSMLSAPNLLKLILSTLDSPRAADFPTELSPDSLADSLAFPKKNRERNNLAGAASLWTELEQFHALLKQDNSCRRKMLLRRLDCTIESFKWKGVSDKKDCGKEAPKNPDSNLTMNELIHSLYDPRRIELKEESSITISDLLASRETECDKLLNNVVSSFVKPVDTNLVDNSVNLRQVIISDVPDRGGRVDEIRAPVKESISQQYRDRSGRGKNNRFTGRGRDRGDRGGFNRRR